MWKYETDESPKRKHHWTKDYAGTVRIDGRIVSKCPKNLTMKQAEELLNSGVEWSRARSRNPYPDRIYGVLDGTLYRAMPTVRGSSYHGFPEMKNDVPPDRKLREEILRLAEIDGSERSMRKWLR